MPSTYNGLVYPAETDTPDVPRDIQNLAKAVEKRIMGIYLSASDRDTQLTGGTAPVEGQVAYLKDTNLFTYYDGAAWQKMFNIPTFTTSTSAPSGGSDGDVWFKV